MEVRRQQNSAGDNRGKKRVGKGRIWYERVGGGGKGRRRQEREEDGK